MKQNSSSRKVNEQAREVIANILLFEFSDPRLQYITITGCEVSFDRSFCNVFYTCEPSRYEQVEVALSKATGRVRSLMSKRLSWRVTPQLRFLLDQSVDQAERIGRALVADAPAMEAIAKAAAEAEAAEAAALAAAEAAGAAADEVAAEAASEEE